MYRERLNVVHFRAVRRNLRGKVPGCRATSDAPSGGFYSYRFRHNNSHDAMQRCPTPAAAPCPW